MTDVLGADLNRRLFLKWATSIFGAAAVASALRPSGALAQEDGDWTAPPDIEKAKAQASEFVTYGIPNDWANYGEIIETGFAGSLGVPIKNEDTDMSSLEEITKFDEEKDNPHAMCADIGLLWGRVAEARGVVPPYLPPSAEALPVGYKAETGGWVATFAGVPAFIVNTDAIAEQGLPTPATWDDLLKPEFKGKIGSPGDPLASGTAQATFLAWAFAHGGSSSDLTPAVDFAKQIIQNYHPAANSNDLLEKGEQVVIMRYDFNCAAAVIAMQEKNINSKVVIPGISIYAPSAIMFNKYNTAKMDLAKLFAEYVLSDEAQTIFAKFGARPIRSVLGQLELPTEAMANWLPEADYAQVQVVEDFTSLDALTIADTWSAEVLGD